MRKLNKWTRKAISACSVAVAGLAAAPAQADVIQLGFILDSSGSIGAGNWTTIVNGLSAAIGLIPVGNSTQYEISVVSFSTGAATIVDSVLLNNAATRTAVQAAVAAAPFQAGSTSFQAAFSLMTTVLNGGAGVLSSGAGQTSYVNFATDGVQNPNPPTGIAERNALIAAGIDNISIEGIGGGVDAADLQTNFCYPQPCDTTSPYNFPAQGFYLAVANAAAYTGAIQQKIQIVVPEPASLALVGLALAAAGFSRRRRPEPTA